MKELGDALPARKCSLWKVLHEAGLLPNNCVNFSIDVPLDGLVTITATYYPDKSIEKAAPELARLIRRMTEESVEIEAVRA